MCIMHKFLGIMIKSLPYILVAAPQNHLNKFIPVIIDFQQDVAVYVPVFLQMIADSSAIACSIIWVSLMPVSWISMDPPFK